jgi:indolepyruvate ferredoxin oxidoreductase beta subunit
VLSLTPVPGEVDIVIGAEFMEAGRAIQRGLVTPDRTTLIASTHRAYAVVEKQTPGDGIADAGAVLAAADAAAKRLVAFDMAVAAEESGSAISAVMFGALAGADVLPFPRGPTRRRSAKPASASRRACAASRAAASARMRLSRRRVSSPTKPRRR